MAASAWSSRAAAAASVKQIPVGVEAAPHDYRTMTKCAWAPVLVDQVL
jgi:hypothetical protein